DASEANLEERFDAIDRELSAYGAGLDERSQVVVLNKADLLAEPAEFTVRDDRIVRVISTSCATGQGIDDLKRALFELCPVEGVEPPIEELVPEFLEYRPRARRGPRFRIYRTDRGYRVVGTPPSPEELEEALRRIGVKRGAEVEVGEEILEWQ
ncbi:MAG: hypothetical protein OEW52_12705, partial [Thermoleophilia bacterium]|nr:hypothetical protein [Thermoleophilia bacterium]